jgi:hypothetical protein
MNIHKITSRCHIGWGTRSPGGTPYLPTAPAIEDIQDNSATGKKSSPRRVAQEGSMAASVCHAEQTDLKWIRDFAANRIE